ncbi:S-formylglutathione hydrolase [Janthinobacterium sp. PC23-8]|uniref:S-formylglutathione hydrolase n=1 Tax=Janthinobacterium sp. PC23-8 TaxID=2012679 RepID=UPI000B974EE8|nr:S-formylglutathione hydrolase [Janthinobacterium sp. PC23-8]OYO29904.1 S-formylglutathione hydrolase [Janthinobacterium sp. PC23-8]
MLELLSEHACFGGVQRFYRHDAQAIGLPMRFSVFIPASTRDQAGKSPALFYLAGLTCTEETFMIKGGAQRVAAEEGLILISPDTSPRGANIAGETDGWDFGAGAGFYVDATEAPWSAHYRMYSYILELRALLEQELNLDPQRTGIFGHSMGGHGALVLALRNPGLFRSVSAFAPITAPSQCPWGKKAFTGYLGGDASTWRQYDASALMAAMQGQAAPFPDGILIDQGLADKFLPDQLFPNVFEAACRDAGQPLTLRRHAGYDHGYYFISTFVEDHLRFHARNLRSGT